MARDHEGLPDNLSPLDPHTVMWGEGDVMHIAIFDHDAWEKVPVGGNILDFLDDAHYIFTLPIWGWMKMAHAAQGICLKMIADNRPIFSDLISPAPFPPDSRHRLYARKHHITLEQMEKGGIVHSDETGDQAATPSTVLTPKGDETGILKQVRDMFKDEES